MNPDQLTDDEALHEVRLRLRAIRNLAASRSIDERTVRRGVALLASMAERFAGGPLPDERHV